MKLYEVSFEIKSNDRFEESGTALVFSSKENVEKTLKTELDISSWEKIVILKSEEVKTNKAVLIK